MLRKVSVIRPFYRVQYFLSLHVHLHLNRTHTVSEHLLECKPKLCPALGSNGGGTSNPSYTRRISPLFIVWLNGIRLNPRVTSISMANYSTAFSFHRVQWSDERTQTFHQFVERKLVIYSPHRLAQRETYAIMLHETPADRERTRCVEHGTARSKHKTYNYL